MRYGIPYETFWNLNPRIMSIYQEEYNRRVEEKAKLIDETAWLNGMYVIHAVRTALSPKKAKYPDKPYMQQEKVEPLSEEEKFKLWVADFNKRFEESES